MAEPNGAVFRWNTKIVLSLGAFIVGAAADRISVGVQLAHAAEVARIVAEDDRKLTEIKEHQIHNEAIISQEQWEIDDLREQIKKMH